MAGIGKSLSRLRKLRDLFEKRLNAASATSVRFRSRPSRLQEIANFGTNPGNLRMLAYVPDGIGPSPPLVVALHGCTQTAHSYDHGTGWSDLADRLGFILVFPEQQPANNPKNCFSWFLPGAWGQSRLGFRHSPNGSSSQLQPFGLSGVGPRTRLIQNPELLERLLAHPCPPCR